MIFNSIINGMATSGYTSMGIPDDVAKCAPADMTKVQDNYFWLLIFANIQGLYLLIHLIANVCHECAKMKNCVSPFCCKYPDTP